VELLRSPVVKGPAASAVTGKGVVFGFRVKGHAGFAEYGKDVVCAGVSAIAQTALLGLQDILEERVEFQKKPGFMEVKVDLAKAKEPGPKAIFRALELGLSSLSKAYPDSVSIYYSDHVR